MLIEYTQVIEAVSLEQAELHNALRVGYPREVSVI